VIAERNANGSIKSNGFETRTHCSRGHEYTEKGTWLRTTRSGVTRVCRECTSIKKRKKSLRTRAENYAIRKHHRQLWLVLYPVHESKESRARVKKASGARYKKRNIERARDLVASLKDAPCTDCKGTFPAEVMDFDHLPGFKKVRGVSDMVIRGMPNEVILSEIAKCQLVCSNCHRLRTSKRRSPSTHTHPG
jgi:hypothetical protein